MSTANPAPAKTPNFPQHTPVADRDAGPNFSAARVGPLKDLIRYAVDSPRLGLTLPGKVFLQDVLGLTGMEISLGLMPPHASIPFLHKHDQNEEVYLFLRGRGEMLVDGRVVPVSEGTAVRVAPDGVRCWRNTSDDDLVYLVIQAKAGSLEQWTGTDGIGVPEPPSWPTPA
jgi:mannose-6-phosphate isomerase-like protein (cupin superfamily)